MLIIGKDKKRKIIMRLGFLWYLVKSLPLDDFNMATELLCNICYDLNIDWDSIQRASKHMEEAMSHRKGMTENE